MAKKKVETLERQAEQLVDDMRNHIINEYEQRGAQYLEDIIASAEAGVACLRECDKSEDDEYTIRQTVMAIYFTMQQLEAYVEILQADGSSMTGIPSVEVKYASALYEMLRRERDEYLSILNSKYGFAELGCSAHNRFGTA